MQIGSSSRIEEGRGPFRARPAIFNGRLYVRHGDALMVYNLRGQEGEMRATDSQQISENKRTDK
ncbi:MAG: hypothetical protein P1P82_06200 [Bacteroidales bacterium]|nr:hypothetical protein [Bacteroidales bacterium]MDT8430460.1 hypothetical protein [Bacteroidales bacterium]